MNNKRLPIAIVVLLGVAGVFVAKRTSRAPEHANEKPATTLSAVKKDEVTSITVEQPGKPPITLERGESGFQVKQPIVAKADTNAVDTMLEKLSDLTVVSVAATRKENHERLEVDPAHAVHVIARAKDTVLADFFLGASKSGGTMLRKEGDDSVYAVKGSLRYAFDKDLTGLRDRTITDLGNEDVTGLEVSSPKGTFRFEKGEKEWAVAKGEKPLKSFAPDKVQALVSSFARLRASGFGDAQDTRTSAGVENPSATVVLKTKDGQSVTLTRGGTHKDGADFFLAKSGDDVLYRISKFTGDRMSPDASAFEPTPAKPAGGGMPPGMSPVAGGGNLPPEILKQLQEQMANGQAH